MKISSKIACALISVVVGIMISVSAFAEEIADSIYHNGIIITLNDTQPRAEAVAVMDGKILTIGSKDEVLKRQGGTTKLIDLKGRTMLPGFFDAHGQFLREDQVDSFKSLGVMPSLFPMHTFYWGDWHREHTLGPELADNISPTGWCVKRGMKFSTHHDAPVAFPNPMRVLDATVTRRSRSGDIIGPEHRVDVMTALKAMTIWPAWQHFEEDTKGSIETGKLADFVILDENPFTVDPEALDEITVVETIKEGVVVFDILETKETTARPLPDESGRAFTGLLRLASYETGHPQHDHAHGSCYCGTLSRLCAVIASGNSR